MLLAFGLSNVVTAQSYDFSITDVQITDPTGITVGSSITLGTALDEVKFDLTNAGSITIPTGTVIPVTFEVGSNSVNLQGSLNAALAPNAKRTFTVDCSAAALNINFRSTAGNFNICVTTTYSNDPRSSNNKRCSGYSMQSARTIDLRVKPGSIAVTDPTGITPANGIPLGTALNQISFEIENVGNFGLLGSVTIVVEVDGVSRTGSYQLSSPLLAGQSTPVNTYTTAARLNLDFPTSNGKFDICITVSVSLDPNKANDQLCQEYTMGTASSTPTVTNMSPVSGPVGTNITISGTNFATSGNTVEFSTGVFGNIISSTLTSVIVTVPATAVTGPVELITAGTALNCGTYTVTTTGGGSHTITSISPAAGPVGTEVTITGTGFNTTTTANTVTFSGGINATVKTATATSLVVDVPTGALSGIIAVTIAGGTKNSPTSFTAVSSGTLFISDFNPKRGAIGQEVTIDGDLFNATATNNIVTFSNGRNATIVSATAKKLVVKVPPGTVDGTFTLNNGSGTAISPQSFFVENGPVITKLNPESGKAGSAVKIEGFNFSTVDSENKVLFGSLDAGLPIVNNAATELEVTVPPGLSVGEHTVRLSVTGFTTISAPKKYRVLSATSGIFESSADNGLKVYTNNEGLNISINSLVGMHNAKITIYEINGAKVFEQGFNAEGKTKHLHIANVTLVSGAYILSFEDENNGIKIEKFMVAN